MRFLFFHLSQKSRASRSKPDNLADTSKGQERQTLSILENKCWLRLMTRKLLITFINEVFIMTDKTPKKTRRSKEEIVRSIEALSSERFDWNRNNLKYKTTIPNLEIIESLLKG